MLATLNWPRLAHWSKIVLLFAVPILVQTLFPQTARLDQEEIWLGNIPMTLALAAILTVEFIELLLRERKKRILVTLGIFSYVLGRAVWSMIVSFYDKYGPGVAQDPVSVLGYAGSQLFTLLVPYLLLIVGVYRFNPRQKIIDQTEIVALIALSLFFFLGGSASLLDYLMNPAK